MSKDKIAANLAKLVRQGSGSFRSRKDQVAAEQGVSVSEVQKAVEKAAAQDLRIKSSESVADAYGAAPITVYRWKKRAGLVKPPADSEDLREQIINLWEELTDSGKEPTSDKNVAETAREQFGNTVTSATVSNWLNADSRSLNRHRRLPEEKNLLDPNKLSSNENFCETKPVRITTENLFKSYEQSLRDFEQCVEGLYKEAPGDFRLSYHTVATTNLQQLYILSQSETKNEREEVTKTKASVLYNAILWLRSSQEFKNVSHRAAKLETRKGALTSDQRSLLDRNSGIRQLQARPGPADDKTSRTRVDMATPYSAVSSAASVVEV